MRTKAELESLLFTDELTGLRTKSAFFEDLRNADLSEYALIYVDLDDFGRVNDVYGDEAGDEFLKVIALKMLNLGDYTTTYRIGGDEFLVVTTNLLEGDGELLRSRFDSPVMHGNASCNIHASFGLIECKDFPEADLKSLVKYAKFAMTQAKYQGKNILVKADKLIEAMYLEKQDIEQSICCSEHNNEFVPHFRPFVDTFNGSIVGFETLARWYHKGKIIKPEKFLQIAMYTGKIYDIDVQMFEETVRFLKHLQDTRKLQKGFKGLSNFSTYTLARIDLEVIMNVLDKYNVKSRDIIIEVTEDCFDDQKAFDMMQALSKEGFYVAIGDFSASNSSIYYLPSLDINILKISKKLIHQLNKDQEFTRTVSVYKFIIDLAEKLHLRVVSEGIDSKENLKLLKGLNVHIGIGPYFSRAVPEPQFIELLK